MYKSLDKLNEEMKRAIHIAEGASCARSPNAEEYAKKADKCIAEYIKAIKIECEDQGLETGGTDASREQT